MKDKNKKKKMNQGFTLVELLAIIVILAIILVITVPQVFKAVDNSKKSSLENSAKSLAKWFEKNLSVDYLAQMSGKSIQSSNANFEITSTWECISDETATLTGISKKDVNINNSLANVGNFTASQINDRNIIQAGSCSMVRRKANSNKHEIILVAKSTGKYYFGNGAVWASSENVASWKNINTSEVVVSTDPSGANPPALAEGMIPVVYYNNKWVKADKDNVHATYKWYNYQAKAWANAVTVKTAKRSTYMNASVGTPVLEADILAYYVWIPRYKYQLFNPNYQ